jgi:predicted membrane channel-forming protein YqfA (hemolysin III family)
MAEIRDSIFMIWFKRILLGLTWLLAGVVVLCIGVVLYAVHSGNLFRPRW